MFSKIRKVSFVVSDLHLSQGVRSPLEDFKHHPAGRDISDTAFDYVLDGVFADFIDWIIGNCRGAEVYLKLLGDTFDPLAVELNGESAILPYEDYDVQKFLKIAAGHPGFFHALRLFCRQPNYTLQVFIGNHDMFLAWPRVQEECLKLVSPDDPTRVQFLHTEDNEGLHFEHGATEPHARFNPERIIIKRADLLELLKRKNMKRLFKKGKIPFRETLDVPQGYYLTVGLENHLKKANHLIGRMHIHGFVWADACMRLFRRSWYRRRSFAFIAAYHLIKIFLSHLLSTFWHMRTKTGFIKILKVLQWTSVGAVAGTSPRDYAMRLLRGRDDIDIVVLGHEHWPEEELYRVGNRHKKYFNTGTWMEMWERRALPEEKRWKQFRRLQGLLLFFRNLFRDADLVSMALFPVLVVSYNQEGERAVRLMRFDPENKEMRDFI